VEYGADELWLWVNKTRLAYCSTIVAHLGKMTSWRVVVPRLEEVWEMEEIKYLGSKQMLK
jgi:hypothetical protein